MTHLTKTRRKLLLLAVLWLFYALSFADIPARVGWYIAAGMGLMTAAILTL